MSGDSQDDKGFTEGTLFDMDATLEDPKAQDDAFDDELEATGAWIPVQEEESEDEDDGAGKTAVLSVDDVMEAAGRSAGKVEPDEAPDVEEPLEKTFVLEVDGADDEEAEEAEEAEEVDVQDEATVALNIEEVATEASEDATVLFEIPVDKPVIRARLKGIGGPDDGGEWELSADSIILGRSKECDLSVKDPTASRKHIRLDWSEKGYTFEDLGSGNGTTLNGHQQKEARLRNGDELGLGQSVLRYVIDEQKQAEKPVESPSPTTKKKSPSTTDSGPQSSQDNLKKLAPAIIGVFLLLGLLIWHFSGDETSDEPDEKSGAVEVEKTPEEKGEEAYERGLKHAKDGSWEEALQALQRAANSDPKNETYSSALARAEEEVGFGEKLEKARAFVKEGNLGDALDLLRGIPSSSSIAAEAVREAQQVEQRYEEEEGARLRDLITEGQFQQAKEEVGPFAERLPDSEDVQALKAALDNGKRAAKRYVAGRKPKTDSAKKSLAKKSQSSAKSSSSKGESKTPKSPIAPPKAKKEKKTGGSGATGKALSMYRSGNFAGAIAELSKIRDAGNASPDVMKTLGDIQSFQAAYNKGQAASGVKAIKPLERAYAIDKRLGGSYARKLSTPLADGLGMRAAEYYANGTYGSAAKAARKALKYDRDHVNAAQVLKKCQGKAGDFFDQGMAKLDSGNKGVAKQLLKMAVEILPSGDPRKAKAKTALGSL